MEPVDRIQAIQKERWELLCGVCRQRCGAKVHLVISRPPCTICCPYCTNRAEDLLLGVCRQRCGAKVCLGAARVQHRFLANSSGILLQARLCIAAAS